MPTTAPRGRTKSAPKSAAARLIGKALRLADTVTVRKTLADGTVLTARVRLPAGTPRKARVKAAAQLLAAIESVVPVRGG